MVVGSNWVLLGSIGVLDEGRLIGSGSGVGSGVLVEARLSIFAVYSSFVTVGITFAKRRFDADGKGKPCVAATERKTQETRDERDSL